MTRAEGPLSAAASHAERFLASLPGRPVGPALPVERLRARIGETLGDEPVDPARVVHELAEAVEPGLVAVPGPRYFGFVNGGSLPAALAADWLTSAWDQNAGFYASGPAAAVAEEVAGSWIQDLLGLPAQASFGFVTGAQMANVTGLAAARYALLERAGWDVGHDGLSGAPPLRVLAGAERHVTIDRALRLLGLGTACLEALPADDQGRLVAAELRRALAAETGRLTIVCAQAGGVNTGAFDPFVEIADAAAAAGAWLHVDGAFGLWAGASRELCHLLAGVERADSWATDAHKWLNVPYDSGIVFCAHPEAHRSAMAIQAAYLTSTASERNPFEWTPEASRRARGFPVYAALRSLGRRGVAELVERCCAHARRFAAALRDEAGVFVLNDVVLNQVLVGFDGGNARADEVVRRVQVDGVCWLGGTAWHGRRAMRISVSNWSTTEADVDRSVASILRAVDATR